MKTGDELEGRSVGLHLPRQLEERLRRRELSLKRARTVALSERIAKNASLLLPVLRHQGREAPLKPTEELGYLFLSARLDAASAKRELVLERRSSRARELGGDPTAVRERRSMKQAVRACVLEARTVVREKRARERREREVREVKRRAARKNAKARRLSAAMKTRLDERISEQREALAARLELAAQRREQLSRGKRTRADSKGSESSATDSDDSSSSSSGSSSPRSPASTSPERLACGVIEGHWRRFRDANEPTAAIFGRFLGLLEKAGFLADVHSALEAEPDISTAARAPASADASGDERDFLAFQKFQKSTQAVQHPAVICSAAAALRRVGQRAQATNPRAFHSATDTLRTLLKSIHPKQQYQRYPVRLFLSAFMIVMYPEIIMSRAGGSLETLLESEAQKVVRGFLAVAGNFRSREAKTQQGLGLGTDASSHHVSAAAFDRDWLAFMRTFVSWKKGDLLALESDLTKMACDLTLSVLKKCGPDFEADYVVQSPDLSAIVQQLGKDTKLIGSKVRSLTGQEGLRKFEEAVAACKSAFVAELEHLKQQQQQQQEKEEEEEEERQSSPAQNGESERASIDEDGPSYADIGADKTMSDWKTKVVHELLHDANYELLPINTEISPEGFVSGVESFEAFENSFENVIDISSVVKKNVERAFWDVLMDDLGASSFKSLTLLLRELREGISRICNLEVHREHDPAECIDRFERDSRTATFMAVADNIFASLCDLGAPVREQAAKTTFAKLRAQLEGAAHLSQSTAAVGQVMRFLYTLYEVLNADIINSQVKALRAIYHGQAAIDYLAEHFETKHGLSGVQGVPAGVGVGLPLPKTESCLAATKQWMGEVFASLAIVPSSGEDSAFPVEMKSGIGDTLMVREKEDSVTNAKGLPKVHRDVLSSAVLQIMAQDKPVMLEDVPEILEMDHRRLVGLQHTFQRLVVLSASCLLLHQLMGKRDAEEAEQVKDAFAKRVNALLLHPDTKLSHLSSELHNLLKQHCEGALELNEESIFNLLNDLLNEDGLAYKSLKKNMQAALLIALVEQPSNPATKANVLKSLKRSGSAVLYNKVAGSAEKVRDVVVIACKIHSRVLGHIC